MEHAKIVHAVPGLHVFKNGVEIRSTIVVFYYQIDCAVTIHWLVCIVIVGDEGHNKHAQMLRVTIFKDQSWLNIIGRAEGDTRGLVEEGEEEGVGECVL